MTRKSDQEEKRIRILEALNTCLQEKSFDKTSIKDIARAAEVNHGLLHYYFKSKEDILINYIDYVILHYKGLFAAWLGDRDLNGIDEIQLIEWVFAFMNERITLNRPLSRVFIEIWETALYRPPVKEKLQGAYREWIEVLAGLFNRVTRDPAQANRISTAIVAFLEGMALFSIMFDSDEMELSEVLTGFQKRILQIL
jgi:AcrR family transcriptional regulator